jgi:SAM-dependent methyltransferase
MDDWTKKHFDDSFWLHRSDMPEQEARFITRALRLRKGQRVLDVPCGAGRTSLALAKLGLDVTGVDLRSRFTNRAKRRFRKEGLTAAFLVGDMRKLGYDGQFDAVVNWSGSFGYFSDAEDLDVLRRFARALRPGGRVLIDMRAREPILRHFIRGQWRRYGAMRVLTRNRWNPTTQRIEATYTSRRGDKEERNRIRLRLYTPRQFKQLLGRAGLELDAMYGSETGAPFSRGSRRLIVVGRKPSLASSPRKPA